MGFHEREIKKGIYGELSKIEEELQEAYDAVEQEQDLMLLIELSDMIGAIKGVAEKYGFSIEQLIKFAELRSKVAIEELNGEVAIKPTNIKKIKQTKVIEDKELDTLIHQLWNTERVPDDIWLNWSIKTNIYNFEKFVKNSFKLYKDDDYAQFERYMIKHLPQYILKITY